MKNTLSRLFLFFWINYSTLHDLKMSFRSFHFLYYFFLGKNWKIRCQHGLIPKPDTITGCGPECTQDYDCNHGHGNFICQNNFCVEKPDPCDPSPCGPGANCMLDHTGNAICR